MPKIKYKMEDVEEASDTSANSSLLDNSRSILEFNFDLPQDRDHYKKDKKCTVCKTKFGKVGLVNFKKYCCKFCYKGVCLKCSPKQVMHPETLKLERICSNCYQKSKEAQVVEKQEQNLIAVQQIRQEVIAKVEEENQSKNKNKQNAKILAEKYEKLKLEKDQELSRLNDVIKQLNEQRDTLIDNFQQTKEKMNKVQEEMANRDKLQNDLDNDLSGIISSSERDRNEIGQLRNNLAQIQDEHVRLIRQIEEMSGPVDTKAKVKRKSKGEEKMLARIENAKLEYQKVLNDHNDMKKELEFKESELKLAEKQIKMLEDRDHEIEIQNRLKDNKSETTEGQEDRAGNLRKLIQENEIQIDKLKIEVEKARKQKNMKKKKKKAVELKGTDS
ncbi:unnamed protein product [Blepharisma stoltei]|uniref:FYVE-type domain-containing protein n=1 Tax=Blepharisma stoltei TaxID=1481888 RepID=A0AAU9ILJ7_9CILI|nr:unnamed protein product [Blepharisma stoltei]